ncbi:hypothetical protein C9374_009456 [Naegleria lovaniensis]|uniref:F-box domain-containing protein n=1 Tax=Naegleria lovaniensis TaxID=51637 RepID=A0AA88GYF9_NAELO|nr:uncharacterized protein C9374_009456 [Naegleria lovaniensis]KAG2392879.1 hypothetical protein C9374_009456 [Naegleria lovaniensis]
MTQPQHENNPHDNQHQPLAKKIKNQHPNDLNTNCCFGVDIFSPSVICHILSPSKLLSEMISDNNLHTNVHISRYTEKSLQIMIYLFLIKLLNTCHKKFKLLIPKSVRTMTIMDQLGDYAEQVETAHKIPGFVGGGGMGAAVGFGGGAAVMMAPQNDDATSPPKNIIELLHQLSQQSLKGELGRYPIRYFLTLEQLEKEECPPEFFEPVLKLLNEHFTWNEQVLNEKVNHDGDMKLFIMGLYSLTRFCLSEIIELSMNFTIDSFSDIIGHYSIFLDNELLESISRKFMHWNGMTFLVKMKSLCVVHTEAHQTMTIQNEESSHHEIGDFTKISLDTHVHILKYVGDYRELLKMRRVCRYWNTMIVENDEIWKYCTYLTLLSDDLFKTFTSRTRVHALKKPSSQDATWMEYFFTSVQPLLELRDSIMEEKKWSVKTDCMIDLDLLENASTESMLRKSITSSVTSFYQFMNTDSGCVSKVGALPWIPKDCNILDIWKPNYQFIAQLNCKQLSSKCLPGFEFIPEKGMLYFFVDVKLDESDESDESDELIVTDTQCYVKYVPCEEESLHVAHAGLLHENHEYIIFSKDITLESNVTLDTCLFSKFETSEKLNLIEERVTSSLSSTRTQLQRMEEPFMFGKYQGHFSNSNDGIGENDMVLLETNMYLFGTSRIFSFIFVMDIQDLISWNFERVRLIVQ